MARKPTVYKRCDCSDQNRPKKGGCGHSWSYNRTTDAGNRTRATIPDSVGLTQAQAQAILDGMTPGVAPEPVETNLTFKQWSADWLSRRRAKEISVQGYESAVRVHLNPRWGRQRLRTIKKAQVEAWVQEMEANKRIANSTADGHWKVFKMILKDALQNGKIASNPTYEVDGPYVEASTSYVFSADECWAIYDEFPKHYRPIPMLGFACGLRQGEALAVCDDVIDTDGKVLTVRRQVLRTKESGYSPTLVDRLKTSPRLNTKNVPIPPYLQDVLDEYMEWRPPRPTANVLWEHKKTITECKRGSVQALFWTRRGNLVCRNHFNDDAWKPTLLKLGIKDEEGNLPTFHDLRHTFISTCLQNGIPEHTVAAWVGDTVEELRRTYSHLLRDHADTHGAIAAGLTARPKPTLVRAAA
ncbi:tyrosine-type recombinase/integrase [Streptomyces stelliscabiei]|uniref:tyrosine-type recombinase/integrase n=1 Tax=Streptomyces stelliscabiei TaxID=146820 RepID=UPI0029BA3425|nr:tyrosine-type recombinase/integrase [Streptomyces stelliscabiei]MDX2557710.1 tyrosine-type recombinase/integrase [Streptomyces stelliscabiei]MDX2667528.1 tyrosine-type recombinase/integrase [Streptomyces stelliscabiei]MDX2789974.1 tyrosine-type recombinase/integrase [Streptomyces stelliscabiei]MDX3442283.1 tyrosine-type recombinase/integrase [Streptomyces stelliscabiei]